MIPHLMSTVSCQTSTQLLLEEVTHSFQLGSHQSHIAQITQKMIENCAWQSRYLSTQIVSREMLKTSMIKSAWDTKRYREWGMPIPKTALATPRMLTRGQWWVTLCLSTHSHRSSWTIRGITNLWRFQKTSQPNRFRLCRWRQRSSQLSAIAESKWARKPRSWIKYSLCTGQKIHIVRTRRRWPMKMKLQNQ